MAAGSRLIHVDTRELEALGRTLGLLPRQINQAVATGLNRTARRNIRPGIGRETDRAFTFSGAGRRNFLVRHGWGTPKGKWARSTRLRVSVEPKPDLVRLFDDHIRRKRFSPATARARATHARLVLNPSDIEARPGRSSGVRITQPYLAVPVKGARTKQGKVRAGQAPRDLLKAEGRGFITRSNRAGTLLVWSRKQSRSKLQRGRLSKRARAARDAAKAQGRETADDAKLRFTLIPKAKLDTPYNPFGAADRAVRVNVRRHIHDAFGETVGRVIDKRSATRWRTTSTGGVPL